ncbi:HAD family hydrolase [Ideonella azotifigens]|uniref:HAD family hydrolase n=1 Tax=Ideonella azotifigens TaxID=513160 RepID=A0ABN1JLI1_9BURK|nr:HAD family hydrolase [Ideonella azotifigens]MCD2339736.1 HAD family hydrolase [Ideonella azotifigens]
MPSWRAITLDLDDTLWPVWPAIEAAEAVLHGWLKANAPATAAAFDTAALRLIREQVGREHPERGHDLSWLRLTSIARALAQCGEDPALAEPAFELFFEHRQKVQLYDDVPAALVRLAARGPVLALTNGNADLQRIGLAGHFAGTLGAREFGVGKPEPAFFHAACERLGCAPHEVLHVGDDWALDIEGAHAAGLASVWLHRPGHRPKPLRTTATPWRELDSLTALADALDLFDAAPAKA